MGGKRKPSKYQPTLRLGMRQDDPRPTVRRATPECAGGPDNSLSGSRSDKMLKGWNAADANADPNSSSAFGARTTSCPCHPAKPNRLAISKIAGSLICIAGTRTGSLRRSLALILLGRMAGNFAEGWRGREAEAVKVPADAPLGNAGRFDRAVRRTNPRPKRKRAATCLQRPYDC